MILEAAGTRVEVETFDAPPDPNTHLALLPCPAYARTVKIILACILAIACSPLTGCSGKKQKSGYRNYEGDSSPSIRLYDENPGSPLNTR